MNISIDLRKSVIEPTTATTTPIPISTSTPTTANVNTNTVGLSKEDAMRMLFNLRLRTVHTIKFFIERLDDLDTDLFNLLLYNLDKVMIYKCRLCNIYAVSNRKSVVCKCGKQLTDHHFYDRYWCRYCLRELDGKIYRFSFDDHKAFCKMNNADKLYNKFLQHVLEYYKTYKYSTYVMMPKDMTKDMFLHYYDKVPALYIIAVAESK